MRDREYLRGENCCNLPGYPDDRTTLTAAVARYMAGLLAILQQRAMSRGTI
jgi:hypothetical protein